jgi:hypothetical protein
MIPQQRWWSAGAGVWLLAGVLGTLPALAAPTDASDEAPAAKPRVTDGWKTKERPEATADAASKPDVDGTATKNAPAAPSIPSDAVKRPPAPTASKSPNTTKGASPAERRAVPAGSGDRSLAAEKAAIDRVSTKTTIEEILASNLPVRSDHPSDWSAGAEPLHHCGEPRWIEPCIPMPPCHPSHPPHPYDLVGVAGDPTCGPIYRGPCCPRTGTHDDAPLPRIHRVNDRLFDAFYWTK